MQFESSIGQQRIVKQACWQEFNNIKLRDSEQLILGHCTTPEPLISRKEGALKVSVIAAWDSPLWNVQGMWGL